MVNSWDRGTSRYQAFGRRADGLWVAPALAGLAGGLFREPDDCCFALDLALAGGGVAALSLEGWASLVCFGVLVVASSLVGGTLLAADVAGVLCFDTAEVGVTGDHAANFCCSIAC